MYQEAGTTVVRKRMGFLSVLVVGATAIIVTTVISASFIGVYSLKIFDRKADGFAGFAKETLASLPEVRAALPPVLSDAIEDERRPDYLEQLDVSVRLVGGKVSGNTCHRGKGRAVVEVTNRGDAVVSLLSMRLVGFDSEGDAIFERNTWAATPLQIEEDWRGPLLPHETRRFPVIYRGPDSVTKMTPEITDIRIWKGNKAVVQADLASTESSERSFGM